MDTFKEQTRNVKVYSLQLLFTMCLFFMKLILEETRICEIIHCPLSMKLSLLKIIRRTGGHNFFYHMLIVKQSSGFRVLHCHDIWPSSVLQNFAIFDWDFTISDIFRNGLQHNLTFFFLSLMVILYQEPSDFSRNIKKFQRRVG